MNSWIFGHVMYVSSELCRSCMVRVALQSNQEKRGHFANNRHCSRVLFVCFYCVLFWSYSFASYIIFYVLEHLNSRAKLTTLFDYFAVLSTPKWPFLLHMNIVLFRTILHGQFESDPQLKMACLASLKFSPFLEYYYYFFSSLFFAWNNLRWFWSQ